MSIKSKIDRLSKSIKVNRSGGVFVIDANLDGTYTYQGQRYSEKELLALMERRGVDVVIFNDLLEDGPDNPNHVEGYYTYER